MKAYIITVYTEQDEFSYGMFASSAESALKAASLKHPNAYRITAE